METPTESPSGYPEEQPEDVTPGGNRQGDEPQRQGALPDREGGDHGEGGSPATESGDGHATGNPNS
jgi:hypothetical protein